MGNCCASNQEDKELYLREYEGDLSSKGIKYRNKLNQQLTTDVFKQGDLAKVSLLLFNLLYNRLTSLKIDVIITTKILIIMINLY